MRGAIILAALLLSAGSAQAQRTVVNGQTAQLMFFASVNPDCSQRGTPVVNVTQQPQHGRIKVMRGRDFVYFRELNIRSVCNRRRVAGVGIHYTAQRGYVGSDYVGAEVVYPNGVYRRGTFNIYVR